MLVFFQVFRQQYEGTHFSADPCELWCWPHHKRQQLWDRVNRYWTSQTHGISAWKRLQISNRIQLEYHVRQFGCIKSPMSTWYANSLVWHRTRAETWPGTGSICCRVERTKTAVFPIPDFAWQITSIPRIAWGMHSCCTDDEANKTGPKEPSVSKINLFWRF